jgi:hypothetical protein
LSTSLVLFTSFIFLGACAIKFLPRKHSSVLAAAGGVEETAR